MKMKMNETIISFWKYKLGSKVFGDEDTCRQKVISLNKDKSMKESYYCIVFIINLG